MYKGAVYINDQSLSDKAIDKLCVKLKNKEPIEISSYMSTKLLDSLCQNAYKRKEIIDFIENMIKQSAFVYGKLDSRFISTLINTYAQLRIDSELVADLISNQILPVKYSLYPDSHKIPIAYSLTCFDAINVNL